LLPIATAMLEVGSGRRMSVFGIFKRIALALARNPLIVATALGLIWGLTGLALPVPVAALGNLFANAAGPCALFALGASLGNRQFGDGMGEIVLMTASRLLVHPLAAWVIGAALLDLDPLLLSVAVIQASMPIAANVFVMARAYNSYVDRVSAAILISTMIAVVTVSCFMAIFAN
jgi:predicted permease